MTYTDAERAHFEEMRRLASPADAEELWADLLTEAFVAGALSVDLQGIIDYGVDAGEIEVDARDYAAGRLERLRGDVRPEGATLLERVAALEKWREARERELDDEAYHAIL